uniref:Rieske domain-containing protein n=1 Tax=Tetradesmus obliquus TaxID=3088 RepID=A0A383WLW0_TETOB|eukprot:jgi/Sobl393_1/6384/SZX78457.1
MSTDFPDAPFNRTHAFDWLDQWYPVGFVKDFDPAAPHRFVLLGIPLVIWHQPAPSSDQHHSSSSSSSSSSSGSWRVFADVCPHRLVPLSEGRITPGGLLECPYHGWAFNGQGGCEIIPQEGHHATPRACATAYPCVVRQGLLFVKPAALPKRPVASDDSSSSSSAGAGVHADAGGSTVDAAGLPLVPEFDDPAWLVQDTWRDVPYDWASLMENVLDASHVPFTHHKSISSRDSVGAYDMRLTRQVSGAGFRGAWATGPRAGALGPQATEFVAPCLMRHTIDAQLRGYESMVVVYAVPIAPGKCRLLNRNAFKFTGQGWAAKLPALLMKAAPGWAIHLGTQVPLEDDQIFLHYGEAEFVAAAGKGKSAAQAYYMPSKADTYVVAFRSWIRHHGNGGPFGDVGRPEYRAHLQPRLSHPQLLDRYSQHTANCAQCQAALKQVTAGRRLLGWAAGLCCGAALLTAAAAVAALAAASTVAGGSSTAAAAAPAAAGIGSKAASLLLAGAAAAANAVLPLPGGPDALLLQPEAVAGLLAGAGLRVGGWAAAAAAAWLLRGALTGLEGAFHTGSYPPPRNKGP